MASIQAVVAKGKQTDADNNVAMNVLFSKIDEGLDDMENGRVQSVEEAWKDIDSI